MFILACLSHQVCRTDRATMTLFSLSVLDVRLITIINGMYFQWNVLFHMPPTCACCCGVSRWRGGWWPCSCPPSLSGWNTVDQWTLNNIIWTTFSWDSSRPQSMEPISTTRTTPQVQQIGGATWFGSSPPLFCSCRKLTTVSICDFQCHKTLCKQRYSVRSVGHLHLY